MFRCPIDSTGNYTLEVLSLWAAEELFDVLDRNRDYLREWHSWIASASSLETTRAFISASLRDYREKKLIPAVIRKNHQVIGYLSAEIDAFGTIATLRYWLCRESEGRGIMSHAVKQLLLVVFKSTSVNRVEIACAAYNQKSRQVPEKLQFQFEGIRRSALYLNGEYIDYRVYSLLKSDWKLYRVDLPEDIDTSCSA